MSNERQIIARALHAAMQQVIGSADIGPRTARIVAKIATESMVEPILEVLDARVQAAMRAISVYTTLDECSSDSFIFHISTPSAPDLKLERRVSIGHMIEDTRMAGYREGYREGVREGARSLAARMVQEVTSE